MIQIRRSKARGHASHGWLESDHTFSFGSYQDPKFTGFRDLKVFNEDRVEPGEGFGRHGHKDMEIISYVLEGELAHQDSLGTGSVIRPGDVQRMSAGTGVQHSEANGSKENKVHFFQIWIAPKNKGIKPDYEEKRFKDQEKTNQLKLVISSNGEAGSLRINQDACMYATLLDEGKVLSHQFAQGRHGWIQVARGEIEVNGVVLFEGDGASISEISTLKITANKSSEALLLDLP